MIYIVTGIYRTGTSMMMAALQAGGLQAAYSPDKNKRLDKHIREGYHPNKHGLYEFQSGEYDKRGFPRQHDGKLIKVPYHSIDKIRHMPKGIRMVYMLRDKAEIDASIRLMFGKPSSTLDAFYASQPETIERLQDRQDVVSFHAFRYHDVVSRPLDHFTLLKDAGWAINPATCAKIPDSSDVHIVKKIQ